MQVQSVNNQNNQPHFNALYKIPAKNIGEKVVKLVDKYKCTQCPSSYLAPKFYYILTPDTKKVEEEFEKHFWKMVANT